jgi:SAM-dependent MidA family methyltransferase
MQPALQHAMTSPEILTLPSPTAEAAAHSDRCRRHIVEKIDAAGGAIGFAEFMQLALYAPGLGYYVSGTRKFGADGDFITAPEVSTLFGSVLAGQVAPVLRSMNNPELLEFGAGSGRLAVDVLTRLRRLDALPARYLILEVSPELEARQAALFREEIPELAERIEWLPGPPERFSGVVLANEVLDALPVERFRCRSGAVMQLCVELDGDRLVLTEREAGALLRDEVRSIEADIGVPFAEGFESEISVAASAWVRDLALSLDTAIVLFTDYGLPRCEYYHADRSGGWLRCYFRHRVHGDPLLLPGIQDITAWVDFTRIATAAVDAGLEVAGFTTQASLMLAGGLVDELAGAPPERQLALSREIKFLTLPGEMGEHFKCMALVKGDIDAPAAITASDRRHRL